MPKQTMPLKWRKTTHSSIFVTPLEKNSDNNQPP